MNENGDLAQWSGPDLAAWRARLGLSQAEAAKALGVHVHSLKNWEGGRRRIGGVVRRLAEAIERERQAKGKAWTQGFA